MPSKKSEETMFERRQWEGGLEDPNFPAIEDLPEEDCYLTYLGNNKPSATFVSRFINKGEPVRHGQAVFMPSRMAAIQLRSHWKDPRTNEYVPYWRLSTEAEIKEASKRDDASNVSTASREALARAAREDAIAAGEASYDTEVAHAEEEAVKSSRRPRGRKRGKKDE